MPTLEVCGLRTLDEVTLTLRDGLTVLLGENGAGKSSILDALELLQEPRPGDLSRFLRRGSSRAVVRFRSGEHTSSALLRRAPGGTIDVELEQAHPGSLSLHSSTAEHQLASDWRALRNEPVVDEALEWVRRGLGDHVLGVQFSPTNAAVALELLSGDEVPWNALSRGERQWLRHVAIAANARRTPPVLVVADEPELHLHPRLQSTTTELYAWAAERAPVLLLTHSDRIVEALGDSAPDHVLLLALDDDFRAHVVSPDAARLSKFLTRYRFGDLRFDGREAEFFPNEEAL